MARGGTVYDDPNRQAVGLEPAWVEGTGGTPGGAAPVPTTADEVDDTVDLDSMTKDELLAHAQELGITPANAGMTKDELRSSIEEAEA